MTVAALEDKSAATEVSERNCWKIETENEKNCGKRLVCKKWEIYKDERGVSGS